MELGSLRDDGVVLWGEGGVIQHKKGCFPLEG
jgi:hypothetical protein